MDRLLAVTKTRKAYEAYLLTRPKIKELWNLLSTSVQDQLLTDRVRNLHKLTDHKVLKEFVDHFHFRETEQDFNARLEENDQLSAAWRSKTPAVKSKLLREAASWDPAVAKKAERVMSETNLLRKYNPDLRPSAELTALWKHWGVDDDVFGRGKKPAAEPAAEPATKLAAKPPVKEEKLYFAPWGKTLEIARPVGHHHTRNQAAWVKPPLSPLSLGVCSKLLLLLRAGLLQANSRP